MSETARDIRHQPLEAVHADELDGEFQIGDTTYGPGTMLYYPDPHFEAPLLTISEENVDA
jgi:hypothetical protein